MAETEQLTTPQPEVHSVETQDEGSLVDDVIFGGEQGSVSDAFGQPEAPVEPALAAQQEQTVSEEPSVEVPSDNDEVRYQYWQSQADKMRNERDQLQQQFNQIATQQATSQQQQPEPEPEIELPAPPEKPQKPYNFNMDEAMTDSNSESAKYLRQEQSWRDEMDDYKNMQFEYHMSDPSSISLDNLWRLYAADKGLSSPEPQKAAPSGEFQQVKRAQQVPASMGVMPSQNRQTEGSMEDTIMDSMIADYNKQNPWN